MTDEPKGSVKGKGLRMRRGLVVIGTAAGVVLLAKKCAVRCGRVDFESLIERMPDTSPPKWVFTNISEIRANTERILERLEGEKASPAAQAPPETPPDS